MRETSLEKSKRFHDAEKAAKWLSEKKFDEVKKIRSAIMAG